MSRVWGGGASIAKVRTATFAWNSAIETSRGWGEVPHRRCKRRFWLGVLRRKAGGRTCLHSEGANGDLRLEFYRARCRSRQHSPYGALPLLSGFGLMVWCTGFGVWGFEFGVWVFEFMVKGLGCGVWGQAERFGVEGL